MYRVDVYECDTCFEEDFNSYQDSVLTGRMELFGEEVDISTVAPDEFELAVLEAMGDEWRNLFLYSDGASGLDIGSAATFYTEDEAKEAIAETTAKDSPKCACMYTIVDVDSH